MRAMMLIHNAAAALSTVAYSAPVFSRTNRRMHPFSGIAIGFWIVTPSSAC